MINADQVLCYDNGGESFDRYTAVFPPVEGRWTYLAMSSDPFHPAGFGQHGELKEAPGDYLGTPIEVVDLPISCQKLIQQELSD